MKAYQIDDDGFLIGLVRAQVDPVESLKQKKAVYLTPAGCVLTPPPSASETTEPKWSGIAWVLVEARAEIARKLSEGRVLVGSTWSEPRPSGDHTLVGLEWVITPERQAEIERDELEAVARAQRLAIIRGSSVQFNQAHQQFVDAIQAINAASTLAGVKAPIVAALIALGNATASMRDVLGTLAKESLGVDQE